jgi:heptosyltransferase-2
VIQTAFLGDAILTLPMIKKLKEMNAAGIVDVLAIPSTKEIFSASPYVDNVIVMDKKEKHKGLFLFKDLFSSQIIQKRVYHSQIGSERIVWI